MNTALSMVKIRLKKLSHRDYTTGFALGKPQSDGTNYAASDYIRTHELVGVVKEVLPSLGEGNLNGERLVKLQVRNKLVPGVQIEFINNRGLNSFQTRLEEIVDGNGTVICAAHPGQEILIRTSLPVNVNDLVRKCTS